MHKIINKLNVIDNEIQLKIKELNKKHLNLKSDIENNQKEYEKLIDLAADEISNFVDKARLKKIPWVSFYDRRHIKLT